MRFALAIALAAASLGACSGGDGPAPAPSAPASIHLASDAFSDGELMPVDYTCDGQDLSPSLIWTGVPAGAASLAITMYDVDRDFAHWVAWGIDPAHGGIAPGEAPPSLGKNDFGDVAYQGPCPPEGDEAHRYLITLWALSEELSLEPGASYAELNEAIAPVALAKGELTGAYAR